jgi:hypothetical protein
MYPLLKYSTITVAMDWMVRDQFPVEARDFSLLHSIQTRSGAYTSSEY